MNKENIVKNDPKTIRGWLMYDWANSVYMLSMTSAIFPVYYNNVTKVNGSTIVEVMGIKIQNTAAYSINLGLAFGFVALISPLVSSVADYTGRHKAFMRFFCYLGALGCIILYFFDGVGKLQLGLMGMWMATVGYAGSIVLYNSYLPVIATEDQVDKISAKGYSYGYFGSTLLLVLSLILIKSKTSLGITDGTFLPRVSFLLVGIWWLGFSQITFSRLPKGTYSTVTSGHYIVNGYLELKKVWDFLKQAKQLRIFLSSFFFYIMGVQSVMFMAASFGEKEVGMQATEMILTVLLLQFLGIFGAYLFAWLSKLYGNFKALTLAVIIWIFICMGSLFISNANHFYIAAFFIGLVMGGVQALSRSTYAKLIPESHNNAGFFSFYDVSEKLAMMLGLVMWGVLDDWTGSMRNSIVALVFWFSIGLVLLIWVQNVKTVQKTA